MALPVNERAELKEFYDDYRTACLNRKYYGRRLAFTQRWALFVDILIAIGASSSFATLKIFSDTGIGKTILPYLAGTAAVIAIVKPFFAFDKKAENYAKLVADYSTQTAEMKRILGRIRIQSCLSTDLRARIETIQGVLDRLVCLDDAFPKRKLLISLQREVNDEIPANELFWPKEEIENKIQDNDISGQ